MENLAIKQCGNRYAANAFAMDVCQNFEQHSQRKLCKKCRHPKEDHSLDESCVQHIQEEVESLAKDCGATEPKSNDVYSWIPPECPEDHLEKYFKHFPDEKVPKQKTEGVTFRLKQIMRQVPPTDVSEEHCRFVEPDFKADLEAHIKNIRKKALHFGSVKVWKEGMPVQCLTCLNLLEDDELVVMPAQVTSTVYHPNCFTCNTCKDQLEDLLHCTEVSGKIYCVRHYSETLKKRCHACDELIFAAKFAQAGSDYYHGDHLLCFHCDQPLEDNKGFDKEGELYCSKCYEDNFSPDCEKCGKRIEMSSRHVTFEDKFWHYDCFSCEKCGKVITKFEQHEGKFYCLECYNENFAPRCSECEKVFEGTTQVVQYENETYHVDCFTCNDCSTIIGTGTFIPHGSHVYCKGCNSKNFGIRCAKCRLAITDDRGIMFNKRPFHRECFTCSRCQKGIADEPFKHIQGSLYCINCYGELFCKKCHSCDKPIYIDDKEVLYSYSEYSWHSACFVCSKCKNSLADTPFTIRGKTLVCKNCTSQEDTVSAEEGHKEVDDKKSEETKTRHL